MIKELKTYTCCCDRCGVSADDGTDYSGWSDKDYAKDVALEADWEEIDGGIYCPDCIELNDNDEFVVKPKL
jgi:hypothetical protein